MKYTYKCNNCQVIFQGSDPVHHLALWAQEPAQGRGKKLVSDYNRNIRWMSVRISLFSRIWSSENETSFRSWKAVAKGWKFLNLWNLCMQVCKFYKINQLGILCIFSLPLHNPHFIISWSFHQDSYGGTWSTSGLFKSLGLIVNADFF